jgi:protein BCP1
MTILPLSQHQDKPIIQELTKYLIEQSPKANLSQLPSLLSSTSSSEIALIISERVINMPHAIVPPLYNFLHSETTAAATTSPAHKFTHYILLSKTYTEVASQLDAEPEQASSKKAKKTAAAAATPEVFYFHPEDEALHRHALEFGNYDYAKQGDEGASDAKRAFQEMGIRPQGHLILIEASKFEAATKAVAEYLGAAE